MPLFGQALDPNPWLGELYQEDAYGYLVRQGSSTVYLRRDIGKPLGDVSAQDGTVWNRWAEEFRNPVMGGFTIPSRKPLRRREPARRPAGSTVVRPSIPTTLTIKNNGVVIIQGDADEGINIENNEAPVITGTGNRSLTMKNNDVVIV